MRQNPKQNNNAILKPAAQSNRLCVSNYVPSASTNHILQKLEAFKNEIGDVFIIALLQLENGLRISEVLNMRYENIDSLGRIIVKASKGSNDKIIFIKHLDIWKRKQLGAKGLIFDCFNRFYVYRVYKKLGLYTQFDSNLNSSVTHSLRYESLNTITTITDDLELKKQLLGHKNINITIRYDRKNKSKSRN